MKPIEIEIQVQIEKKAPLLKFLKEKGQFLGKKREVDEYFSPEKSFLKQKPIKEWLRLRNTEGQMTINYKNWHYDKEGRSHHCDEYETSISDSKMLKNILLALKFTPIVKVDKTREKYLFKNYEIVIDNVVGLGTFLELEFKGRTAKKPAEITSEMIEFLKGLKVGKIYRNYQGYPFLLLFPNKYKVEEF